MSDIAELNEVVKGLKEGRTATPVTIRKFLSWFGAKRRTTWNVEYINQEMAEVGLQTVPGYLNFWIDTPITFELVSEHPANSSPPEALNIAASISASGQSQYITPEFTTADDPSFRIGRIESATKPPVSVKPNASG